MESGRPLNILILLSIFSFGACDFFENHAIDWKGIRGEDKKDSKDPAVDPAPNEATPSEVKFAKSIQDFSLLNESSENWSLELTLKIQSANGAEELQTLKLISDAKINSEEKLSQKKIIFQNSDNDQMDLMGAEITCFDINCASFAGVLKSQLQSYEGTVEISRKRYVPKNANIKMEATFVGRGPLHEVFQEILDPVSPSSALDPRMRDQVKSQIDLLHIKNGKTFFELSRFVSDRVPFGYAFGVSDVTSLSLGVKGSLGKNSSLQLLRKAKSQSDENELIDPLSGNANFGITKSDVTPQKILLQITRETVEGQFLIEIEI